MPAESSSVGAGTRAVFLSYASQDAEPARRIADALRAFGVEVWLDQSELRGGDAWDQKIRRQIHECALFLPVISQHTQERAEGYFRREWKLGVDRTQDMAEDVPFIVPVVIDDTSDAHARVPDKFREVQWTRLPGGETRPVFAERVKALLGGLVMETGRPRPVLRDEGVAAPRSAQPRRPRAWLRLAVAAVGAAALGSVLIWQPWRKSESPAVRSGKPVSEARQLAHQVMTMLQRPNVVLADLEGADQLFEKAKALDPTDAEVWAAGAQIDGTYVLWVYDTSDARKAQARAKAARALQLAPDSYAARSAQAFVLTCVVGDPSVWSEAELLLGSLLNERPDDKRMLRAKGKLLSRQGRDDEAAAYFRRADDPISEGWAWLIAGRVANAEAAADRAISSGNSVTGLVLKAVVEACGREDLEAAQTAIDRLPASELLEDFPASWAAEIHLMRREPEKILELMRAFPRDWFSGSDTEYPKADYTAWAHRLAGRPAAAQADWRAALGLVEARLASQSNSPPLLRLKAYLLACLGERDEAERNLRLYQQLRGQPDNEATAYNFDTYILLGRHDGIIEALAAALKDPKGNYVLHAWLRYNPRCDPLRGDSRFEALLRETLPKGAKPFDDQKPEAGSQKPAVAPSEMDRKSIAVLPFTNMSEEKEASAFFADGMHEDVITNLALIRELRVVSRTTAETYRGTKKALRQIGEELGVAYVLEGSVRRIGNKVRVTGQLIDARTDEHVWAKSYDRDLTDIFAIQAELAQAIAAALQAALSPQEKSLLERRPTENLAAYDLFLKARDLRNREGIGRTSMKKQETLLQSAVTLDPNFAAGWAEMTYACGLQYLNYYDHSDAMRSKATVARDNAVRLAPEAPEVIRAQGDYCYCVQHDYPGAIEHYQKLVRLQPNEPTVYWSIANVQRRWGRWAEAVASYRKGTQLDPRNTYISLELVNLLGSGRRYPEAIAEQRRGVALHPDTIRGRYILARISFLSCGSMRETQEFFAGLPKADHDSPLVIALRKDWAQTCGEFPEAIRLDRLQPYSSDDPTGRADESLTAAVTLAAQGDMTAARARLEDHPEKIRARLELDQTNPTLWRWLGQMEALLGHSEEAVRCARKAVELMPESLDTAVAGPGCSAALAFVYVWTGDKDRAIAEYSRLLRGTPGGRFNELNVYMLRHGPWAFPLRDDPRFQALLADPKSNAPLF